MDSLIIQTAIGLLLIFATFSALVSVLTEAAARFIGLRGEYLLRGIRTLVDGESHFKLGWTDLMRRKSKEPKLRPEDPPDPLAPRIVGQPMVSRSAEKGSAPDNAGNTRLSVKDRRRLPSYVSGRSFARALICVLVPDASSQTTIVEIKREIEKLEKSNPIREPLLSLVAEAGDDIARFRQGLAEWYDDHMARVAGWYKRHVRWISLGIAAVVVIAFNINAVEITRSLYTDEALRGSVVAQAVDAADCTTKEPVACLTDVRNEIRSVRTAGISIGWGTVPACAEPARCNWLEQRGLSDPGKGAGNEFAFILLVLVGWVLMGLATLPGARFWFDALSRLGSLRSTGPKPPST